MDCKPESAARTLCRISLIAIQGVLHGIVSFLLALLFIPGTFAIVVHTEVRARSGWAVILLFPWFLVEGILGALLSPFVVLWKHWHDIREVVAIEWRARWLAASPKKPDGEPIPEREFLEEKE